MWFELQELTQLEKQDVLVLEITYTMAATLRGDLHWRGRESVQELVAQETTI